MQRDPDMSYTYDTWRELTRHAGPSRSRREVSGPPQPEPPTTPKKGQKIKPMMSPGNPFRSPQKPTKQYAQTPQFPLASHEVPAAAPDSESDVSDMEVETAPVQTTPKKAPASPLKALPLYTPRTKARKRLRGEDVTTPPHGRLKRNASQKQHVHLLAQSPREPTSRWSMSRLFRGPSDDLDGSADESYGPSPRKSQDQRGFCPMFETPAVPMIPPPIRATRVLVPSSQTSDAVDTESGPAATTQRPPVPLSHPTDDTTVVDIGDDDHQTQIHVRPYRRFGSFASSDPEDVLALPSTSMDHYEEPTEHFVGAERLSEMESMILTSPQKHAQRALQERRARNDEVVLRLVGHANPPTSGIVRTGRAGLDVDEDASQAWDDDWASETSSADYGLGDGGMDETDVV